MTKETKEKEALRKVLDAMERYGITPAQMGPRFKRLMDRDEAEAHDPTPESIGGCDICGREGGEHEDWCPDAPTSSQE